MFELLIEGRHFLDQIKLPIDDQTLKATLLQVQDFLTVLALAPPDQGGDDHNARALLHLHDQINHLADGLAFNRQARGRRIGNANPGKEQAEIIIDLCDRTNGGAGVLRRCLLLNRDGRRQALNRIHLRLLHQFQELTGIG